MLVPLPCGVNVLQVLMQVLRSMADPSSDTTGVQGSQQQQAQPLAAADVQAEAERLLEDADLTHLLDDERLQNK
jgi:hypothetical protein